MRYTNKLLPGASRKTSTIGIGASAFGYMYNRQAGRQEAIDIIKEAYAAGINYFDTSPWYGQDDGCSEKPFAEALRGIDRSSFFMATKIGWYGNKAEKLPYDFSAERLEASIKKSLHHMQLEYLDVVTLHQPDSLLFHPDKQKFEMLFSETLPALDRLRQRGIIKHVGVNAQDIGLLKTMVERSPVKVDTALSWGKLTLVEDELLQHVSWFKERNIGLITASPLHRSLLVSSEDAVPKQHHFHTETLEAGKVARQMCAKEGIPIERLALGYCVEEAEKAGVDIVLFGVASLAELRANLSIYENGLSEKERNLMNRLRSGPFGPSLKHRLMFDPQLEYFEFNKEPNERLIN